MSQFLKQSTAATIMFGPFVDKTDGVTLEVGAGIITSIDHATIGIFLSKAGGTAAIRSQAVTASTLDAYGMFKVTLSTTDTNTVGTLDVLMAEAATFLPVHKTFMVLPANVYDSLMGTDLLDISAVQLAGVAQSLTDLKDLADTGYDPATHKVAGVVLTDTTTTNTDMRGTDSVVLAGPTKAEMDTAHALLTTPAQVATALGTYDAPTKAEMDTAHALLATVAKQDVIDGIVDNILIDTGTTLDANITAIKAKTDLRPSGIPKGVEFTLAFKMVLSSDHVTPATGKTIVETISKDGGAFAACTNTFTEISNGWYKIVLTATEMNATMIALKFTETDCDQRDIGLVTST